MRVSTHTDLVIPDWPAPAGVNAFATTRHHINGHSEAEFANFNLGINSAEKTTTVCYNRSLLNEQLPDQPLWLMQVHGRHVIHNTTGQADAPQADASYADTAGRVCAVLTADCLPVLLCDVTGTFVAAVHAGWRGLHAGIIAQVVDCYSSGRRSNLMAWLGPAISRQHYQVGSEFRERFIQSDSAYTAAFEQRDDGWYADLYQIARYQLEQLGISAIFGGNYCTYEEAARYYSHRRDQGRTGRQASIIWLS